MKFLVTLVTITLLLVIVTINQKAPAQAQQREEEVNTAQIKCSITVESGSLSRGGPSPVLIQLENTSGGDIAFRVRYSFYLKRNAQDASSRNHSRLGDSYWSPAGIVNEDGQLLVVPHALKTIKRGEPSSYRLPNDVVRLRKGESKLIRVDLTPFPWNDRILSGWPAGNSFADVPKGSYLLEFAIHGSDEITSNQVAVSLD